MVVIVGTNRMGCTSSVVFPDEKNDKLKQANGVNISIRNGNPSHLKGDYSQLQLAKHNRDKYVKQRQGKTFAAANEMSGRIMEERELLSLGTRSRGTSRDTSRATSPTSAKKTLNVKEEVAGAMTPVAEDLHSRDSRRIEEINHDEDDEELVLVHKNSKTKSTHKVKKKHKVQHKAKPKDKSKKHKKIKKSKAGKGGKESLVEADNVDSGLEDNNVDNSDEEPAAETVAGDNDKDTASGIRNDDENTDAPGADCDAGDIVENGKSKDDTDSDKIGNDVSVYADNADLSKADVTLNQKPDDGETDTRTGANMEENKI